MFIATILYQKYAKIVVYNIKVKYISKN